MGRCHPIHCSARPVARASFPGRFRRLLAPRERGQSNNGDGYFDLRINPMRATASLPSFFSVAPALAALLAWPSLAVLAQPIRAQHVLLEAAQFGDTGGWDVDQQSMDVMGSPYLLAHGLGVPVKDAVTTAKFRRAALGLPDEPEDGGEFDLVVVGGGIAGTSTALWRRATVCASRWCRTGRCWAATAVPRCACGPKARRSRNLIRTLATSWKNSCPRNIPARATPRTARCTMTVASSTW